MVRIYLYNNGPKPKKGTNKSVGPNLETRPNTHLIESFLNWDLKVKEKA